VKDATQTAAENVALRNDFDLVSVGAELASARFFPRVPSRTRSPLPGERCEGSAFAVVVLALNVVIPRSPRRLPAAGGRDLSVAFMFDDAFPNLSAGVAFASRIEREVTIAELASPRQNNESHCEPPAGSEESLFHGF